MARLLAEWERWMLPASLCGALRPDIASFNMAANTVCPDMVPVADGPLVVGNVVEATFYDARMTKLVHFGGLLHLENGLLDEGKGMDHSRRLAAMFGCWTGVLRTGRKWRLSFPRICSLKTLF